MPISTQSRIMFIDRAGFSAHQLMLGLEHEDDFLHFLIQFLRARPSHAFPAAMEERQIQTALEQFYMSGNGRYVILNSMNTVPRRIGTLASIIESMHYSPDDALFHAYTLAFMMKSVGLLILGQQPIIPVLRLSIVPNSAQVLHDMRSSLAARIFYEEVAAQASKLKASLIEGAGARYATTRASYDLAYVGQRMAEANEQTLKRMITTYSVLGYYRQALGCALAYLQDPTIDWVNVNTADLESLLQNMTWFTHALTSPDIVPCSSLNDQVKAARFCQMLRDYLALQDGKVSQGRWIEGQRQFASVSLTSVGEWLKVRHVAPVDNAEAPLAEIDLQIARPKQIYNAYVSSTYNPYSAKYVEFPPLSAKLAHMFTFFSEVVPFEDLRTLFLDRISEADLATNVRTRVTPYFVGQHQLLQAWYIANMFSSRVDVLAISKLSSELNGYTKPMIRLYGLLNQKLTMTQRWYLAKDGDEVYIDIDPGLLSVGFDSTTGTYVAMSSEQAQLLHKLSVFIHLVAREQSGSGVPVMCELPDLSMSTSGKTDRVIMWMGATDALIPATPRTLDIMVSIADRDVNITSNVLDDDAPAGVGDQEIVMSPSAQIYAEELCEDLERYIAVVRDPRDLKDMAYDLLSKADKMYGRSVVAAAISQGIDRTHFMSRQGRGEVAIASLRCLLANSLMYHSPLLVTWYDHLSETGAMREALRKYIKLSIA